MANDKHAGGRPTKCTPETRKKIIDLLRVGNFRETAAAAAGIDPKTLRTWLKWGADGTEPYASFSEDMDKAEAEAEAMNLMNIAKAASHDWRAAAWRLERGTTRWAQKNSVEVTGKAGGPVEVSLSELLTALAVGKKNAEPSSNDPSGDD